MNATPPACSSCRFSKMLAGPDSQLRLHCIFNPPAIVGGPAQTNQGIVMVTESLWPLVKNDQLCGQYVAVLH